MNRPARTSRTVAAALAAALGAADAAGGAEAAAPHRADYGSLWIAPAARTAFDWRGPDGVPSQSWSDRHLAAGAGASIAGAVTPELAVGLRGGLWVSGAEVDIEEAGRRLRIATPWGTEVRAFLGWHPDPRWSLEFSAGWGGAEFEVETERPDGSGLSSKTFVDMAVYGAAAQFRVAADWSLRAEVVTMRSSRLTWDDGQRLTATTTTLRTGAVYHFR